VALGPYATREAAEAALGFRWPEFDHFRLESSDTFSLLVLAIEGAVVRLEKHPRYKSGIGQGHELYVWKILG